MDASGYDTSSSDDDFCVEQFRIVRRRLGSPPLGVPTLLVAAESPDPPSSPTPMSEPADGSGDAKTGQQHAGTDQEGAGAVDDAPMAPKETAPSPVDPLHAPAPPPAGSGSESSDAQPAAAMLPSLLTPPYTVDNFFGNYTKRREGLIRALTQDAEAFFQKCDPGMQPLCLYGGINGSWEVKVKKAPVPYTLLPEPEPHPGINLSRDTLKRDKWLQEVAGHCDAWLSKISESFASYLTPKEKDQLFAMIHHLKTVEDILLTNSGMYRCMPHVEEKKFSGPEANEMVEDAGQKEKVHYVEEKGSSEMVDQEKKVYDVAEEQRSSGDPIGVNEVLEEAEDDAAHDDDDYFCASCGSQYNRKGFWIRCDECKTWYHGKCVNIKARDADHIGDYVCPDCYCEKVGHDCD